MIRVVIFTLLAMVCLWSCNHAGIQSASPTLEDNANEQHRPQFHFTPEKMWMNDPNGMVHFDGEFHLFYQHYPDSTVWGPMHWGHAVSQDLVHWEHLPIALYPDTLGYIFSGSAVIDWNNTSGLGKEGQPPMIAIFTYHDPVGEKAGATTFQTQGLAYSNDKGRTWTKYEANPIIPNPGIRDFRDPKVIWEDQSKQWVMTLAAGDHVKFYVSTDLKAWKHSGDFGKEWGSHKGVWECPDLFPILVEQTNERKWALLVSINPGSPNGGSGTQYFIGQFNGQQFVLDPEFAQQLGTKTAQVPSGLVFEDFENGYGDWRTEGHAFGNAPAQGTISGQQHVEGYTGVHLVNSFLTGDKATGKLTSPTFTITEPFINFQIGGGNDQMRTALHLLVDGQIVRSVSGNNAESLSWKNWDVAELIGQQARLEIIDNHDSDWGHINVDQIVFSSKPAHSESEKAIWLDYGRDNYAGVTWSDIPPSDGRRLFMGWMSNWDYANLVPTQSWRSAMTLPRAITLQQTEAGLRLFSQPVEELQQLRNQESNVPEGKLKDVTIDLSSPQSDTLPVLAEVIVELAVPKNTKTIVFFELLNQQQESYRIGYDTAKNAFFSDRTQAGKKGFSSNFATKPHLAPRLSSDEVIRLQLFIDVASAELFADKGLSNITDIFFPNEPFNKLHLVVENGEVEVLTGKVYWLY